MGFFGNNLWSGPSAIVNRGMTQQAVLAVYDQWGLVSITNTNAETSAIGGTSTGSLTIPANYLQLGTEYEFNVFGAITTDAVAPTLRVIIRVGGVPIYDSTALTVAAGLSANYFETHVIARCSAVGASGQFFSNGFTSIGSALTPGIGSGTFQTSAAINTTQSNAITITYTWGTASANNTLAIGQVDIINMG